MSSSPGWNTLINDLIDSKGKEDSAYPYTENSIKKVFRMSLTPFGITNPELDAAIKKLEDFFLTRIVRSK